MTPATGSHRKKRSRGRIDGTVALLMAVGVAPLQSQPIDVEALIG